LQQKLNKGVRWTCTPNDSKIVQNFKKMHKNLPILNFPNEGDDLVLEMDASNEHLRAILKINDGEKVSQYCNKSFNKAKCNYPVMKKEILVVIRGIDKFEIFLAPTTFLIRTNCKGIFGFVKKEFIKYASARATPVLAITA